MCSALRRWREGDHELELSWLHSKLETSLGLSEPLSQKHIKNKTN